jgi:colanic acid/amylovoran biosynthesis glycosyltransferase
MNSPSVKIAYVLQIFPYLTETFIYREILALREAGVPILTVANRPPSPNDLLEEAASLMDNTVYIFPLNAQKLFWMSFAFFYFALRHPRRFAQALKILFSERSKNPRVWMRNFMHLAGGFYLAWRLRDEGISHLHAHFSTNAASLACFVACLLDLPFSMTVHNEIFAERLLLDAKLRRAKFIACISDYSRNALIQDYPQIEIPAKSQLVRCGVLPRELALSRHAIPVILSAAQLVERKGTAYLIAACSILKQRGIVFHCIIAGDGEERPRLEAQAQNLEEIRFVGAYQQGQIDALFAQADIFVLSCITSRNGDRDGIPVVLMEAMAAGLPVISTKVSGIPELIEADANGLLVEEKDAEALADAIERLLGDEGMYHRLRESAKETIATNFHLQTEAKALARLFHD